MFENIFKYIDLVVSTASPTKILMIAIDGVAPRSKLNQQRVRRFSSFLESKIKERIKSELKSEILKKGLSYEPEEFSEMDSNVITPGTEFMLVLSNAIKEYIAERVTNDPLWQNLQVIFSDSSVPGEGEHKILDFLRAFKRFNLTSNRYG